MSTKRQSSVKVYRTDVRRCFFIVMGGILVLGLVAVIAYLVIRFTGNGLNVDALAHTPLGVIQGRMSEAPQGGHVEEYLGIPFAKPPVGKLRYADPEAPGPFTAGRYEATDMKNACIQYLDTSMGDFVGLDMWNTKNPLSEDCLFLNIWVPSPRKTKRAVMLWIYGGGFYSGSNSLWTYDGKAMAAHTDLIIASFNYRVGSLGYLTTGDGRIKGNFGIKDQVMAMQWIKDNIEYFGGDPDEVTLFGESSGASSAGLHMMSNHSDQLFRRAIFESGSPDSHWSFMTQKQARQRSEAFFKNVQCPNDENVIDCLRELSADTILNNEWVDLNFLVFPWAPSVDGDFLTDTPYNLLKAGKFQHKEALLGVNKDEGTFWILFSVAGLSKDTESLLTFQQFKDGIDVIAHDLDNATKLQIIEIYKPKNSSDKAGYRDALDKISGDRAFTCPTLELTDIFAESGIKSYFYYLTYRASNEVWPPWMGVIHGAEIAWVFGMPLNSSRGYTAEEVQFSKDLMDYWANFARTGNPNGRNLPDWPVYANSDEKYLELKSTQELVVKNGLRKDYCQFWKRINKEFNTGVR